MTHAEFEKVLDARLSAIRKTLSSKVVEYATDDRLHNFKESAETFGGTPAEACWGFMLKHLVSIKDMAYGRKPADAKLVNEKIGDAINYLVLLEAIFLEGVR